MEVEEGTAKSSDKELLVVVEDGTATGADKELSVVVEDDTTTVVPTSS